MIAVGIDPGPVSSGLVCWNMLEGRVEASDYPDNSDILKPNGILKDLLEYYDVRAFGVERLRSYGGRPMGNAAVDTVEVVGQFMHYLKHVDQEVWFIPRPAVADYWTGTTKIVKPEINYAMVAKYGGKGNKRAKGPLFGIKDHTWDALAIALILSEMRLDDDYHKHKRSRLEAFPGVLRIN